MTDYIHGGSDAREVARLEKQARFFADIELKFLDAAPGHKVLDLATGVGATAGELARLFPGIELVGLDLRPAQLRHARERHPVATYVEGDAARMPFDDATFDRVHCSWLLEHLQDPLRVLREVLRVLKPGGFCQFIEVDNATFSSRPDFPEVRAVMDALNAAQIQAGGDPFVGRRLEALLREAGFEPVRRLPGLMVGNPQNPVFFQGLVDEFAEIFESLDEALGPERAELLRTAAQQLRTLPGRPEAELRYEATFAQGVRPPRP